MIGRVVRIGALVAVAAVPAQAAVFDFCWRGEAGYTMTGWIAFDDALMGARLITEDDVTGFQIKGFQNGQAIGSWSLDTAGEDDTWLLRFDPMNLRFLTGGSYGTENSQGWNANGGMLDCGPGGFGFNSGNLSQDFCLDGEWIRESAIDPATPFFIGQTTVTPQCEQLPLLGGYEVRR